MRYFIHKINQILSAFCGSLMVAMMMLLVVDIVARSLKRPVQGMAELSVFVMMVVIYLGMARCEEHREHVNLEIVKNLLPSSVRRAMDVFAYLLALLTAGLLLYAVSQNAWAAYVKKESLEGTVELRIWPVKFIIVVGLVFFWVQILLNTIERVKTRNSKSDGSATGPLDGVGPRG